MKDCFGDYKLCGIDKRLCIKGLEMCAEKRQQVASDNAQRSRGIELLKKQRVVKRSERSKHAGNNKKAASTL